MLKKLGTRSDLCDNHGAETTDESTLLAYFRYPSKPPLGESILCGLSNYQVTPRGFFVPSRSRKG